MGSHEARLALSRSMCDSRHAQNGPSPSVRQIEDFVCCGTDLLGFVCVHFAAVYTDWTASRGRSIGPGVPGTGPGKACTDYSFALQ